MSYNSSDVGKLRLCRTQIHSLEDELGKLKAEHLACDVERRRLERELVVKNSELENLSRKLGFSKDTEAKAIARYDQALEYNKELEVEVGKLMAEQLAWDFERRKMERKLEVKNDELEDLTRKLGFSKDAEADAVKRYEQALEYNREVEAKMEELKRGFDKERGELLGKLSNLKDELMQREVELEPDSASERQVNDVKCSSEGKFVGDNNGTACHQKKDSHAYIQKSDSDDVSSDASNDSDDSSSDVGDHKQDAEQTKIQFVVVTMNGMKITARVEPSLTIGSLKSMIQEKLNIPSHKQILIFEGKRLKDSCTLAHYDIQKESIIDLVFNLP
ncbi:uncharacterized protein LOC141599201 [Silene latifolia]|uniref:uncharacterized protein LOC141599201 n=1 Tax=Silene latifolia TaxID=37657 RepID=UPI003D76E2AE